MGKIILFSSRAAAVLFFVCFGFPRVVLASDNLVANPSLEIANATGNAPADWAQEIAGSNDAVFSYPSTGARDGARSVIISISQRTSGSADLATAPISVTAGKTYLFQNYYKSSAETETDVEFQTADGNLSWKWLGNNPTSADWKAASYTFTVPVGITKIRIYQALAATGYLQTDGYSLLEVVVDGPIVANNVPNASLEQTDAGGAPLAWNNDNWGTNTPVFTYDNSGYEGNHSVKVRLTEWTSGDARWYFDHREIQGGQYYFLTDYYKSNVATDVYVQTINAAGQVNHLWLGSPAASTSWAKFSAAVFLPEDVVKYTILHTISKVGYLSTDNYSFKPLANAAFNRGIVSIVFDDGLANVYQNALPIMNQYGFKSTQYIVSGAIGSQTKLDLPAMTKAQISTMYKGGHEIGSHTVNHPDLTSLNTAKLNSELSNSKKTLDVSYSPVNNFAIPFGRYNDTVIVAAKKYYGSARTSDGGENTLIGFDQYRLKTQYVVNTTTLAEVESWLAQAAQDKAWLIILYHNVADGGSYEYTATKQAFSDQLAAIKNSGLPVLTVRQALNEIKLQLPL